MKRMTIAAMLLSVCSASTFAGGLVTNSNQSASFLRNPARDAVIDIDGVYTNPAGVSFMPDGLHLGITAQHPEQQRNVTTTYAPLAMNVNRFGEQTHRYKGQASAPVVPSLQAAYVMDKWTVSASFAICGGGGKCEFDNGIGSIESVYATLAGKFGAKGYSLDAFMKGRQYYYGVQLGAGYKVTDQLAVFAGMRCMIGNASYTGHVRNLALYADGANKVPMPAMYLTQIAAAIKGMGDPTGTGNIEMTTDQSCVGWTPVIGIDYRINEHWNVAAKYEFRTKMALENSTEMNDFARNIPGVLDKFNADKNRKVRDDIPGTLTLGVQYSPISTVRISGGYHWYDDCNAKKYNDEQNLIDAGTREFLAGAEWDVTDAITVSAGWQNTHYSLSDAYMQDMSYNVSSNLLGLGVRVKVSPKVSIDLGYMHNFYGDHTVKVEDYKVLGQSTGMSKTDLYERKNDVVAIGANVSF